MSDLKREELMRAAQEVLDASPPGSFVAFKFTCRRCGERNVFEEPNKLFERGECVRCGLDQPVDSGGFLLAMRVDPSPRPGLN
ncbi:MAG: hypothetical protein ACOYB2_11135 [Limnohabitans sp.]